MDEQYTYGLAMDIFREIRSSFHVKYISSKFAIHDLMPVSRLGRDGNNVPGELVSICRILPLRPTCINFFKCCGLSLELGLS